MLTDWVSHCARICTDILAVIARLDRAIQYSETSVVYREAAAYWIPRLRGE
jgi:hypothetical protein